MNSSYTALITAALSVSLFFGDGVHSASSAPAPPPNFLVQDVLTQLEQPMSIRFLPDGRMLLLEKKGKIRIVEVLGTTPQQAVYLDLASSSHLAGINHDQERGLIDVAIDPAFPSEPYVYLFYTPATGVNGAKARIARFTHVQNSGGITSRGDVTSEVMIWEDTQGYDSCCHFGGGLDFGPDGHLWLTTGDHFQGSYAASLQRAGGSVVRVDKNGSIPAGNPYVDGNGLNVDSLFAKGLRNPFRARWDIPSGRFFIAEVGGNTQSVAAEDLHIIRYDHTTGRFVDSDYGTTNDDGVFNGINFGWPVCEGQAPYTNFPGCNIERAGEPLFAYPHAGNTAAINGGVVYRGTQFPAEFQGAYFYADSTRDFIRYLKFNSDGSLAANPNPAPLSLKNPDRISYSFDLSPVGRIVALEVGPDGALYYVSFTDSGGAYGEPNPSVLGAVRRYVFSAGNVAPKVDQFSVVPVSGSPPLNVEFTLKASDADSSALEYVVFFGDGGSTGPIALVPGATVSVLHTYLDDGFFIAHVEVSDGSLVTSASVDLRVGNGPAIASVTVANDRQGAISNFFRFGDTLTFSATASDSEDGPMAETNFTWSVDFIRPGNIHPVVAPISGASAVQFSIPAQGQGFSGPVFYRCYLSVTDSSGLTTSTNIDVFPEKANITFDSVPQGILVQVDGNTAQPTPFVLDSLINLNHVVTVPSVQCIGGTRYEFTNWSNGELAPSHTFAVPETNSVLTASYFGNGSCTNNNLLVTSGLVLHVEADLNLAFQTGNVVAGWLDQSGWGNDLTAGGQPTFLETATPSGGPAIRFDGVDDKLERVHASAALGGFPSGNANRSMFLVARYHQSAAWGGVGYGSGLANQAFSLVVRHPSGELTLQGWGSGNDLVSTTPGLGAGWLVQSAVLNSGNAAMYRDGVQIAQWPKVYNTVLSKLVIGQEIAALGYMRMDVAAVLIYNRALTASERSAVENYLRGKYIDGGNTPPNLTIDSPTDGSIFEQGEPIQFIGTATDAQDDDTILSASIVWTSDRDGNLGTNKQLTVSNLSVGNHLITAFVEDSQGAEVTDAVQLSVVPGSGSTVLYTNNLVLHLESTQGITGSGGQVNSWADFSSKNNHVFGFGNPVLIQNATPSGRPAIRFASGDRLERLHSSAALTGLPLGNTNRTAFFVAKYGSSEAWGGFAYGNGAFNQAFGLVVRHPTGELVLQGWGGGQDLISTSAGTGAGWLIQSAMLQGGNATLFKNGAAIAQWNHTYNTVADKLVIGQEIAGLGYMGLDVAAVLVYDRALTAAERTQVEAYLSEKYLAPPAPTNQPPTISISTPTSGAVFTDGQPIVFAATATDPEQGNLSASIVWTSSISGAIGGGASVTNTLVTGNHTITASVTDNGNLTGTATINVTVGEPSGSAITPTTNIHLFNGQSLAGLYPWFSNSGFSDPAQVFRVTNGLLHVSGNGWGVLTTSNRYRDYTMILEFKWGTRTWGSRQTAAKDAGLLFHSNGAEGGWSGLLMPSIQAQILEGSMGDLLLMRGVDSSGNTIPMAMTVVTDQVPDIGQSWNHRGGYRWNTNGVTRTFTQDLGTVHWSGWDPAWVDVLGYRGSIDIESADGQWNQMVIVAQNDTATVFFNGIKINEISSVTPTEGKLQLEVEFAEFMVRRWELRPNGQPLEPMITSEALVRGTVGQNYNFALRAVSGTPPFTWSIASGGLPTGLTLNPTTGEVSGQPSQAGQTNVEFTVADSSNRTDSESFILSVSNPGSLVTNGLVVHFESDANVPLQSGNILSGWNDRSGRGNNLTAFGSPRYGEVQTPSGLPAISLNGAGDKLQRLHSSAPLSGLSAGNTNRSIVLVAKYNALTAWAGVAYGTGSANQAFGLITSQSTGNLVLHGWGSGNDLMSTAPGLGAGWIVHSGLLNNGIATHYLNGTAIGQFTHTYNTVLSKLVVGEETAGLGYADMDVAAVLIYNRALGENELRNVEGYLYNKYLAVEP